MKTQITITQYFDDAAERFAIEQGMMPAIESAIEQVREAHGRTKPGESAGVCAFLRVNKPDVIGLICVNHVRGKSCYMAMSAPRHPEDRHASNMLAISLLESCLRSLSTHESNRLDGEMYEGSMRTDGLNGGELELKPTTAEKILFGDGD